jgi:hypothetical protein
VFCGLLLLTRFQHVVLYSEPSIDNFCCSCLPLSGFPFFFFLFRFCFVAIISLVTSTQGGLQGRMDQVLKNVNCLLGR